MIRPEVIEKLFDIVDETTLIIGAQLQMGYLHAMCASCQNLMTQNIHQSIDHQVKETLQNHYDELEALEFNQEEVRKALQLALLKGLKADGLTNSVMTPDSIALMVGYLAAKFIKDFKQASIADLTVGTGNFLTAVLNHLEIQPKAIYGVDLNADLLQIACVISDMQEHKIQFYQQSSLKPLLIEPLDTIIGDLPIDQLEANQLEGLDLALAHKGCQYLPYLLIENHLSYLKPGGYAFYLIPNDFFNQDYSADFHQLLTKQANIQALLQLPLSLFKAADHGKSLFVIQKHGDQVKPINEVLVAQLPNLNDPVKFGKLLNQIESWFKINK